MTPLRFTSDDDRPARRPREQDRRAVRTAVLWFAVRWLLVGIVTAAVIVAVLAVVR